MFLKLALLCSLLGLVASRTHLTDCLDDNKYCVGLPRGCIGTDCIVAFSSISNGTHTEIELFGTDIHDKSWIAIAYSSDKVMKDDFVVFCVRDEKENNLEQKGGLAHNGDHSNKMIGTIKSMKEKKTDKSGFELEINEYDVDENTLYCKMSHRVEPIIDHFNMTKVEILMAKGVWIKGNLTYHGKSRNNVGTIDLSGKKKEKKNSASGSLAFLSSAITFLAAKMLF
uniref:DOMON domain-containing protein n=1 Tax=Caenorhabditis tropicalis TaxID=1561998 RepID=A0A1I7TV57_9PELO